MDKRNRLLRQVELRGLWAPFHKDWLLAVREVLRPQLSADYAIFVESEAILVAPAADEPATRVGSDLSVARAESKGSGATSAGGVRQATLEVVESCELFVQYTLQVRRAPENRLVAVCELLSPTNKGVHGDAERGKYLRKRDRYLAAGVSFLEVDALAEGEKMVPSRLLDLKEYRRNVWTVHHREGSRSWRGWGWNDDEAPPTFDWFIEDGVRVDVPLAAALERAAAFNPWERILASEAGGM